MNSRNHINEDKPKTSEEINAAVDSLGGLLDEPRWKQRRNAVKISAQARKLRMLSTLLSDEAASLAQKNASDVKALKRLRDEAELIGESVIAADELADIPELNDAVDEIDTQENSLFYDVIRRAEAGVKNEEAEANRLRPELQKIIVDLSEQLEEKKRLLSEAQTAQQIVEGLPVELRENVLQKMQSSSSTILINKHLKDSLARYQAAKDQNQELEKLELAKLSTLEENIQKLNDLMPHLDNIAQQLTGKINTLNAGIGLIQSSAVTNTPGGLHASK